MWDRCEIISRKLEWRKKQQSKKLFMYLRQIFQNLSNIQIPYICL